MSANIERLDKAIDNFDNVTSHVNEILKDLNEKISDTKSVIEEVSIINKKVEDNKNEMTTLIKENTQSIHDNIDDLRNNFTKTSEDNKNDIVRITQENINYSKNETIDRINDGKNQINDSISLFKSSNELKQNDIQKNITSGIDNAEHTITRCVANNKDELLSNIEKKTGELIELSDDNKKEILKETLESIEISKKTLNDSLNSYKDHIINLINEKDVAINERLNNKEKRDTIYFISNIILSTAIFITIIVLFTKLV